MMNTLAVTGVDRPALAPDAIHVWRLPHDRGAGRDGLLRLLGAYAGAAPETLRLETGEHGRPSLAPPHDGLHFNWSHSGGVALVALALGVPRLGIDVEVPRPRARILELATRYFSAAEAAQLERVPEPLRLQRFVQLWTAKEAVLKAHGRGISYGLHRVEFCLGGESPRPLRFQGDIGAARDWCLQQPNVGTDVVAHLAWTGGPRRIGCFQAPPVACP